MKMVSKAVQNDSIWAFMEGTIIRAALYAKRERKKVVTQREGYFIQESLKAIAPDLVVRHGPFKGMVYPQSTSVGSSLVPKLLGSYERELHPILEAICAKNYTEIVDIGCAEGYYAVGLAMRLRQACVYVFDTDEQAINLCKQMAQANHVAERLKVAGAFCDSDVLKTIPLTTKALIVSDCEGYEKKLFTEDVMPFLARHDVLIEVHDYVDIETSLTLRQRFQATHAITVIRSLDDITKAHSYNYEELRGYDLGTRRLLLAEQRAGIMEWFYMTPLN